MYLLAFKLHTGDENGTVDGAWAEKLYSRVIDEGSSARAMTLHANLLDTGSQGVTPDPARAEKLYNQAIDECGLVSAVIGLANMLNGGADGVEANPARAVELYNRATGDGKAFALGCFGNSASRRSGRCGCGP